MRTGIVVFGSCLARKLVITACINSEQIKFPTMQMTSSSSRFGSCVLKAITMFWNAIFPFFASSVDLAPNLYFRLLLNSIILLNKNKKKKKREERVDAAKEFGLDGKRKRFDDQKSSIGNKTTLVFF